MAKQTVEELNKEKASLCAKLDISAAKLSVLNPLLSQMKNAVSSQEAAHDGLMERYREVRAILDYAGNDSPAQEV